MNTATLTSLSSAMTLTSGKTNMLRRLSSACLVGLLALPLLSGCAQDPTIESDEMVEETSDALVNNPVSWMYKTNVAENGSVLSKSGGGAGWNAGALSTTSIASGNGYVQFTAAEDNTARSGGLGTIESSVSPNDIEYSIRLDAFHKFSIYEGSSFRGTIGTYQPGDVFRVEVLDGQIRYLRNGAPFYTTTPTTIPYPLALDTSFDTVGGTLVDGALQSCGSTLDGCIERGMWKNVKFVSPSGNTLTRLDGTGWTAGASTYAKIESGNGYVEFSTNEIGTSKAAGLNNLDTDQGPNEIDYSIRLINENSNNFFYVYEGGGLVAKMGTYAAGDMFRIEILDGQIRYLKNGVPFHTSTPTTIPYPLVLDTSLQQAGATITQASIVSCASGDSNCIQRGMWKNVRFVMPSGNDLQSTAFGNGWYAGASSHAKIASGNGHIEFTTDENNKGKAAGLSFGDPNQDPNWIDYSFRLLADNRFAVYVGGGFRGFMGTYFAGDVFRVEVLNGQVRYLRNGALVYSLTPSTINYPLILDTSLEANGATIRDAVIVEDCTTDAECNDNDPSTLDTCEAGACAHAANGGASLLSNGDLEQLDAGMPQDWQVTDFMAYHSFPATTVSSDAAGGLVSLKIEHTYSCMHDANCAQWFNGDWTTISQDVSDAGLQINTWYRLSFSYKTNSNDAFQFAFADSSTLMHATTAVSVPSADIVNDMQWHTASYVFAMTPSMLSNIHNGYEPRLALYWDYNTLGTIQIDNVSLVQQ